MKLKACTSYTALYLCMVLMTPASAKPDPLFFQPRLEAGVMSYSFESEAVGQTVLTEPLDFNNGANFTQVAFEYHGNLSFIGGGGTIFFRRFFLDLSGNYAFDGDDSETLGYSIYSMLAIDYDNDYLISGFWAEEPVHAVDFDRREVAVSLGYAIGSRSSLFAGYKWSSTHFDSTYQGPFSAVYYYYDGPVTVSGRLWGDTKFKFKYDGPFIGAIQSWEFTPWRLKGSFTASLALAYLHGRVISGMNTGHARINLIDGWQPPPEATQPYEAERIPNRFATRGDSLGLTFGMAWMGSTAVDGLSYSVGINGYRYEFDARDKNQSDINETAMVYKFGVAYEF